MPRRMDVELELMGKLRVPRQDVLIVLWDELPAFGQKGKLIVPGATAEQEMKWRTGTVLAVGDKVHMLKQGDRVLMQRAFGSRIKMPEAVGAYNKCVMVVASEDQIDAVLEGKAATEKNFEFWSTQL